MLVPEIDPALCHEEHARLEGAIQDLCKSFEFHVAETHAVLANTSDVSQNHAIIVANGITVGAILDELLGKDEGNPLHPGRTSVEGMSHKVDSMWTQSQNGGLNAKISATQQRWLVVWGTVIFTVVEAISKALN